jgi:hypothetical protein
MDHVYIDENSVAERYLNHSLPAQDVRAFEEHVVDCQECGDRLLLAEMFHGRNGHKPKAEAPIARVVLYKPRRIIIVLIAAGLAIPATYLLWALIWFR